MKTIIIFNTAVQQKIESVLKESEPGNNKVFFVVPQSKCKEFSQEYKDINFIPTDKEYMDYNTLITENRIPDIRFDEAWIPSSQLNNIYAFGDVYAFIENIDCKKVIWIAADGSRRIIMKNNNKLKETLKNAIIKFTFWKARKKSFIMAGMKGYRW